MKTTSLSRSSDFSPQSAAASVRHRVSQSRNTRRWLVTAALIAALTGTAPAQVPQLINYQGRVAVNNVNFDGTGLFRFALVDGTGNNTYWSNAPDDDPVDGVPDETVSLTVTKGLYSVLLGDATTPNMAVMPPTVFNHPDVRLRVWFDDGVNGSQLLSPDQRIAAVGYAMMAGNVPDAAITSNKLAAGAVGAANIATGAVGTAQLADLAITGDKLRLGTETGTDAEGEVTLISGALSFTRTFDYPFTSPPTVIRRADDPAWPGGCERHDRGTQMGSRETDQRHSRNVRKCRWGPHHSGALSGCIAALRRPRCATRPPAQPHDRRRRLESCRSGTGAGHARGVGPGCPAGPTQGGHAVAAAILHHLRRRGRHHGAPRRAAPLG